MDKNINESDFDWTNSIPDNPVRWVKPRLTLDNVEKGEDGWPLEYGNGEGEVWVDFERFSNMERMEIIKGIESYLGKPLHIGEGGVNDDKDVKLIMCTSNRKKGLLLHCGHEDNHFFAQENHVCCMGQTYNEFIESERVENPSTIDRPIVNGGLFLEKENLTEEYMSEDLYYKGANPTVDLVVIRGDEVLLIQRANDSDTEPGKWALPGGFHDTTAKKGEEWREDVETTLEAAKREVKEETGLDVDAISGLLFQMVGVYEGGGRDPRDKEESWTRSTVYMVRIPKEEGEHVKGMDDAQRAEWVSIDKVLQHKLAFDHHKIVEKALTMNESEAREILKTLLTESSDMDWVGEVPFKVTDDYIRDLMSNCEDIPVTNYNLSSHSPYTRRGKMNVYYHSMCPFWWDKVKDEPLDENGRGKGEWLQSSWHTPENSVAIIMPDRNGVTDIRNMDNDEFSVIAYDLKGISRYFNGEGGELWIFLDENGGLRYDLIPDHLVDEVRKGFEGVERSTTLEESFDWTEDIPEDLDQDLYELIADTIDNEVSQGPYYDQYVQSDSFRKLDRILTKYDIDTGDMSGFFTFGEPTDKNGKLITNYQLHDLKQDLVDAKFMLSDKDEEELLGEDFEWMEEIRPSWLRLGQKFTNVNNLNTSRRYEPKDKVQVGGSTFEIYDINEKDDEQYLRFTHNDVMSRPNWEQKRDEEIGKNYRGLPFKQAKHNIDTGFWIPLTDCEFIVSTHPNLVGKTKPDGSPYGHVYCLPDTSFEHMSNIKESNGFDWMIDVPDYDGYRFFDVYVCGDNQYDEETGEDECLDGGSYFLKIPKEEVEEIWDLEVGDMGGIADEGLGVIEWAEKNDKLDTDDYAIVEYVLEVDRTEFCHAVGHNNRNVCPEEKINESDFDWAEETPKADILEPGKRMFIDFTQEPGDEGGMSFFGAKLRHQVVKKLGKVGYNIDFFGGPRFKINDVCFLYLENYKTGPIDNEVWDLSWDDCSTEFHENDDYQEIYDTISGTEFEANMVTPKEFLRMADNYLSIRGINESDDFDWAKEDVPPFYTLEWKEHPLAIASRQIYDDLDLDVPNMSTFENLKHARKDFPNGKWISVVSGPNWIPAAFDDDDLLDGVDVLGDKFEVYSSNMDEPEIMTMDSVNSYMGLLELEP